MIEYNINNFHADFDNFFQLQFFNIRANYFIIYT